ncbi:hypothetical protein [Maribacter halichondriae]|uniref:hypothetical protein n=1 Tax=Maribacter halichondriae TaxID=2980554 RepID=UPI002358A193|nr:hypothetical protein [Maribacter sp. Hal144]
MKKQLLVSIIGLFSLASFAHNPDASTTMLVEKENNVWVLQISTSLTAFQQEIRTHYAETPYKSPEEFQKMVLEHINNNFHLSFNGGENITLDKGLVKLGHETKVVFEVLGIPSDIQSVRIKNTSFKDISRNQNAFMLFKEGFNKEQFVLNNANDHTLTLEVNGKKFVEASKSKASFFSPYFGLVFIGLLGIGYLLHYVFSSKKWL